METQPSIKVNPEDSVEIPNSNVGSHLQPSLARLYEIDCRLADGNLEFFYSKFLEFPVADETEFLDKMRNEISSPTLLKDPPLDRDIDPGNHYPLGTLLSVRWPDHHKIGYLIFKISDNLKNIQFSSNYLPFTMDKANASSGQFSDAGKFDKKGNHIAPRNLLEKCKHAYFIVNGPKLPNQNFDPFIRRFNIHVELLEFMTGTDTIINRIPIAIDPDVRNPGGN